MVTRIEVVPTSGEAEQAFEAADPAIFLRLAEKFAQEVGLAPGDVRVWIVRSEVARGSTESNDLRHVDLKPQTYRSLARGGINTVDQVLAILDQGTLGLSASLYRFGTGSLRDLIEKLKLAGHLPPDYEPK